MQIKYLIIPITALFMLLVVQQGKAQKVSTNNNGDRIIVYSDGSWRYFDDQSPKDVALLKGESTAKEQPATDESEPAKSGKYIKISSSEEREARRKALRYADQMAAKEQEARAEEMTAILNRKRLKKELKQLKKDPEASLLDLEDLEDEYELSKNIEKEAKAYRKTIVKESKLAEKMVDMNKMERDKVLAKMEARNAEEKLAEIGANSDAVNPGDLFGGNSTANNENDTANRNLSSSEDDQQLDLWEFTAKDDVLQNPPAPDCKISFNGVDEFTGRKRRDVQKQKLFSFTSDKFRPFLKGKEHILCEGFVSSLSGGYRVLSLAFSINSENAKKEFGSIPQGSVLTLKFLDGKSIRLDNKVADRGRFDASTKMTYYKGQYIVGASEEKQLRKKEVDKLRIVWGTGYEDYEIYEMDFFMNQFDCLENSK
ncbi:MAG: hypothetical protein AB8G15_20800 [Saprospiraceae bacterium]